MSTDPTPIRSLLDDLMGARGWKQKLVVARVRSSWEQVVGAQVAEHCHPIQLHDDGTLEVIADSAAWATQLSYLRGKLLDRLQEACGPGMVTDVRVRTNQRGPRRR
jgi:predicted nucleic acid-binding Zn ribbon protein